VKLRPCAILDGVTPGRASVRRRIPPSPRCHDRRWRWSSTAGADSVDIVVAGDFDLAELKTSLLLGSALATWFAATAGGF